MPVLINAFGSPERMAAALGVERLDELGGGSPSSSTAAARHVRRAPAQAGQPVRRRRAAPKRWRRRPARRWSRRTGPSLAAPAHPPLLAGRRRALHHAAHGVHARSRSPARATSACTGSRCSTTRRSACTGRSTRARAEHQRLADERREPCRWPSRSAATRARSTRPPRRCRPASTRWSSRAGCAGRACRWCRARPSTSRCPPRPRSCWRAGSIRRSGGSRARSATTPATTRWRATIRCSTSRRSRAAREPDLPDHHRGPPAAGGLLARQGHRAHLPADHPADAARGRGHEHAGRGRLPQPGDRLDQEALPGPGAQGDVRALGPRAHDAGQDHRGGLRARQRARPLGGGVAGHRQHRSPARSGRSSTGRWTTSTTRRMRHRFGGKLGVDATEKSGCDGIAQPWPEEIVMSDGDPRAGDAALDGVRALARARRDRRPAPPRRDQVRAHRLRPALRLRRDGAGRRRLAGLGTLLGWVTAGHGGRAHPGHGGQPPGRPLHRRRQPAHGGAAPAARACWAAARSRGAAARRARSCFVAARDAEPALPGARPARASLFLVGYSYTKRFTWLSHWILGFTDGIAAAGGWIAVRGRLRAAGLRAVVRAHGVDRRLRPDLRLPGRRRSTGRRGCTRFPPASGSPPR